MCGTLKSTVSRLLATVAMERMLLVVYRRLDISGTIKIRFFQPLVEPHTRSSPRQTNIHMFIVNWRILKGTEMLRGTYNPATGARGTKFARQDASRTGGTAGYSRAREINVKIIPVSRMPTSTIANAILLALTILTQERHRRDYTHGWFSTSMSD